MTGCKNSLLYLSPHLLCTLYNHLNQNCLLIVLIWHKNLPNHNMKSYLLCWPLLKKAPESCLDVSYMTKIVRLTWCCKEVVSDGQQCCMWDTCCCRRSASQCSFCKLGEERKSTKNTFQTSNTHFSHMPTNIFKYHLNKSFTMQTMQTDTASYTYFMYLWQLQEFCTALHKCWYNHYSHHIKSLNAADKDVTHMCADTLWWWWHLWGTHSKGHSGCMDRTD